MKLRVRIVELTACNALEYAGCEYYFCVASWMRADSWARCSWA